MRTAQQTAAPNSEKSTAQFKADYAPKVENPKDYLEKFKNAGWEYVWGSNGYHYFCTETPEAVDPSVFNSEKNAEDILKDKKRQISGILGMALFGLAASFLKLYLDVSAYSEATQELLQKVGRSVAMDLIAAAICGVFVIGRDFLICMFVLSFQALCLSAHIFNYYIVNFSERGAVFQNLPRFISMEMYLYQAFISYCKQTVTFKIRNKIIVYSLFIEVFSLNKQLGIVFIFRHFFCSFLIYATELYHYFLLTTIINY